MLEMMEGMAVYAEILMPSPNMTVPMHEIGFRVEALKQHESMGWSFGYTTGALYSFLLFESGVIWKPYLTVHSDLSSILKDVLGITQLRAFEDIDLSLYGYERISAEEREWVEEREIKIQNLFADLENYPQLRFYEGDYNRYSLMVMAWQQFNLPELGLISRGYGDFIGSFGHLEVTNNDNFLIRNEFIIENRWVTVIAHDIEISENQVTARNWVLYLNQGYHVIPHGDNYKIARIN